MTDLLPYLSQAFQFSRQKLLTLKKLKVQKMNLQISLLQRIKTNFQDLSPLAFLVLYSLKGPTQWELIWIFRPKSSFHKKIIHVKRQYSNWNDI